MTLVSALLALFAFGLALFCSLRLDFYLGPTLLSFVWAFMIYALSRPRGWIQAIALVLVVCMTPIAYKFCVNWKKIIDIEKTIIANAYMDKIQNALLVYYDQNQVFPVDESFAEVVWILSELEIVDPCRVKYSDRQGRQRVIRYASPCLDDPWGARYVYAGQRKQAILISGGPDLRIETADDVVRLVRAPY